MNRKRSRNSAWWSVELTTEELLAVHWYENQTGDYSLINELTEHDGVNEVEYNPHFGAHIAIHLDDEYDNSIDWSLMGKTIERNVQTAVDWYSTWEGRN